MENYLIKNAKIYTQDKSRPWADALTVKDGKFTYVGNEEEAKTFAPDAEEYDAEGRFIMPGIVDSHAHIAMSVYLGGDDDDKIPMYDCKSKGEILEKLQQMVKAYPLRLSYAMFYGKIEALGGEKLTRDELDRIVKHRPVILMEEECHSVIMNSGALRYFKIKEDAKDIASGLSYYDRDEKGRLTGMMTEMAATPLLMKYKPSDKQLRAGISGILDYLVKHGVTTIFDAGNMCDEGWIAGTLKAMDKSGEIPVRFYMTHMLWHPGMVDGAIEELKRLKKTYETDNIKFETMKMMLDGTMRIHTAYMVEPYNDTGTRGNSMIPEEKLLAFMRDLNAEGFDFHLHTVGEAAVRMVMNCVQKLKEEAAAGTGEEFTINVTCAHDEMLRPEDIDRFMKLGIVANFTPSWNGGNCGSDPENMQRLLGEERGLNTLRTRTVFETGATVSLSSDEVELHSMERWSPFWGMEVGHTRQEPYYGTVRADGRLDGSAAPVYPPAEEVLDIEQCIEGYTINGAKQLGIDDRIGSIETGKDADFLVLAENLFEMDKYGIHDVVPDTVVIKGKRIK